VATIVYLIEWLDLACVWLDLRVSS